MTLCLGGNIHAESGNATLMWRICFSVKVWYIQQKYLLVAGGHDKMQYKILLCPCLLVLVLLAVACAGCGKADKNAGMVMKQVENTRRLEDFDRLVNLLNNDKKISAPVREACCKLAFDIFQEKIEAAWKAEDADGLTALDQKLTDTVCDAIHGEPLREHIRECVADLQKKALARKQALEIKKLHDLQTQLHLCDLSKKENWKYEHFIRLQASCADVNEDDSKKVFSILIAYGLVLTGRELPETLPDPKVLQRKKVLDMCSRCRTDGREPCYGCHGTGVCQQCKGRGYKKVAELGFKSEQDSGWRSRGTQKGFIETTEACPTRCLLCKGDKFLMRRCKKCDGLKYIVNKRKLYFLYAEQYRLARLIMQRLLADAQNPAADNLEE